MIAAKMLGGLAARAPFRRRVTADHAVSDALAGEGRPARLSAKSRPFYRRMMSWRPSNRTASSPT